MSPIDPFPALPSRRISRRGFLVLSGGVAATAGLAACTSGGTPSAKRVEATSPRVVDAERARRVANTGTTSLTLQPGVHEVDLGGVEVRTWTYGGTLPGDEIRVKRGDVLSVRLENGLPQPTTVHWHGLALRNDMDGVPGLTQEEIRPGQGFDYEFVAANSGTHWFHPHVGTQLDRGLYAPLIVEDPADGEDYDTELVIVLDDWLDGIDTDPDAVLQDLKKNGMTGMDHGQMSDGMGDMGGMPKSKLLGGDAGDVTYPHVIANGRIADAPRAFATKPGQRVRLRLINAASDTAFRVGVPGVPMRITHTDGYPVKPTRGEVVLLGMGERVDAVITVPDQPVPVLALAEGRDAYAQVLIRPGASKASPANDSAAKRLGMLPVHTVADLEATEEVALPSRRPDVVHDVLLEGPGDKYEWTINGKAFDSKAHSTEVGMPIRSEQRVRLRFRNDTEMFHPMHLHGHTFQVRGEGGRGALKDTVIVLPKQTLDVDFDADNPGQWLTHCHNIYHGEAGMMAVVSYVE